MKHTENFWKFSVVYTKFFFEKKRIKKKIKKIDQNFGN